MAAAHYLGGMLSAILVLACTDAWIVALPRGETCGA